MGWLRKSLSDDSAKSASLGILSFEAAKTMSRLLSLYESLSNEQVANLKGNVVKSRGVAYLNSMDEGFLLGLACAERLEDLDKSAMVIARLGQKCSDLALQQFGAVYTDLKLGTIDFTKLEYKSRDVERKIAKMEKFVYATQGLFNSLEGLAEMEISEKKMKIWKKNNDVAMQGQQKANFDSFAQNISIKRKQVRLFKEASLWNQTFDKCVRIMARITCIVYARICYVFGPYIPVLPATAMSRNIRFLRQKDLGRVYPELSITDPSKEQIGSKSGPIPVNTGKTALVRFYTRKSILFVSEEGKYGMKNNRVLHAAGPATLGGSGLALRYADVILLAERYLDAAVRIGNDARENLYEMLPENLKVAVRRKLGKKLRRWGGGGDGELLAAGWRDAVEDIMGWLGPMARDTVTWQMERNLEKRELRLKPSVLLVQTLHFSDKEKTEAAIAEVLVGLSCIYRYENRLLTRLEC
ncbi:hypothetical protein LguiA_016279 [Lonicera macranthoides]